MGDYIPTIEITPEMLSAGVEQLVASGRVTPDYEVPGDVHLVRRIFESMMDCLGETRQQADVHKIL